MSTQFLFIAHLMSEDHRKAVIWLIVVGLMSMLPVIASIIDLFTAISASKRVGEFKTTSYGLRKTIVKDRDYLTFFFFAAIVDACLSFFVQAPILCILCAASEVLIEWLSVRENMQKARKGAHDPLEVAKAFAKAYGIEDAKKLIAVMDELKLKKGDNNGTNITENSKKG